MLSGGDQPLGGPIGQPAQLLARYLGNCQGAMAPLVTPLTAARSAPVLVSALAQGLIRHQSKPTCLT